MPEAILRYLAHNTSTTTAVLSGLSFLRSSRTTSEAMPRRFSKSKAQQQASEHDSNDLFLLLFNYALVLGRFFL
jgi:hypothetical protein